MAAPEPPPPPEGSKPLSALLSGIAQAAYYGNADITEELLRGQLYPEAAPEEFRALRAKMGGLLQVPGLGGVASARLGRAFLPRPRSNSSPASRCAERGESRLVGFTLVEIATTL
uniref:COMMD1 N-terminal domain-containing protein n=1 Tax=Strix occidentalis caurina TaxID=311401 RepID=A0A8D0FUU4_STROC